jgi:type II secretory ATPase GspE/PulE/Tfp pilus assembly ATPase PilB-like protein
MIMGNVTAQDIETEAKENGMITMTQDGFLKLLEGITTIEEVLRVSKE